MIGAKHAESDSDGTAETPAWLGEPVTEAEAPLLLEEEASSSPLGPKLLGAALILLAFGWLGAAIWSSLGALRSPTLPGIVSFIGLTSAPLVLLGLVWLIFGKSSRRETERFSRVVGQLRNESAALDSVLQIVTGRLEESYARLGSETARLMATGDEASDRLARVTQFLSKEAAGLDTKSQQLENAANAARVDIGVLLQDLPRAEEQARAVAEAMKDAGFTAHAETGQLESQLSALVARGREADEVVGGAAQRLAAHLARIQSTTITASAHMDQTAAGMTSAVDDTMARTAEAVDAARASLEAQGQAMLAMIEQSRAALEQAGEASGRNLAERLDQLSAQIEAFAGRLAAQDAAAQRLVTGLGQELTVLDERFTAFGTSGTATSDQLGSSIAAVHQRVAALAEELGGGRERTDDLIGRAQQMAETLSQVSAQIHSDLAPAFETIESRAAAAHMATEQLAPLVEALQVGALDAANQVSAAEAGIGRQQDALEALLAQVRAHVVDVESQLRQLEQTAAGADAAAGRMAEQTGPELVEALVRVREAASQAAERAREAITAVIPGSAAALAEASFEAMNVAIAESTQRQIDELTALSERAVETARAASERLTRQMMGIGEATSAVEARIEAAQQSREQADADNFAHRVAMLIDSLNSAAIDVAKIMANDVTDSAWAAYLKGDKGVFTRRAVRLLSSGEAREIAGAYASDPELRGQVNRYVHDFEAMLRRILADREGQALGVTLLSSDMGKLYVALAQAIERLR